MVWQAFIDDSKTDETGTFVLAGHIATAEAWAAFSKDWEQLLPWGALKEDGTLHFKMSEMAKSEERMSRVAAFYRVIEQHVTLTLSCAINVREMERALKRVWVPGHRLDWAEVSQPFVLAFRCLLDMFHTKRELVDRWIPSDSKIDFIFDDQGEKGFILKQWDDYIKKRPDHLRRRYGATPRFEKDEEFLPLQAADFSAWWIRKQIDGGQQPDGLTFTTWSRNREEFPHFQISFNEDQLVKGLVALARPQIPWVNFYDLGTGLPVWKEIGE